MDFLVFLLGFRGVWGLVLEEWAIKLTIYILEEAQVFMKNPCADTQIAYNNEKPKWSTESLTWR